MYFREIEAFGPNLLTVSALVLASLTLWQTRAYFIQAKNVWRDESTESLSLTFSAIIFFCLTAFTYYGHIIHSLVLLMSGLLVVPSLFILAGAWSYGEVKRLHQVIMAVGIVGLSAYFVLDPKPVSTFFGLAVAIPLGAQLRKLYVVGTRGVVSGEMLLTYVVKNGAFTTFAFTIPGGDPVLKWCAPIWLILSAWLMIKWLNCPRSERLTN